MASEVARLFDAMDGSYDELEPWYEHLYAVLHRILRAELAPSGNQRPGRALDAGCGTGFQTRLLGNLGYEAHGVDISAGLLAVASRKLPASSLARASIEVLPYRDASFDVITCCGSTLSFVDDPASSLREIGRVLRPGGLVLLECEHKWSVDLAWMFLSSVTFDSLGYGVSVRELLRQIVRPLPEGFVLDYPCALPDGALASMRIRLFTRPELDAMLRSASLRPVRVWGIHSITNLIPSTVLHRKRLPRPLAPLFRKLCVIDRALSSFAVARAFANSLVILAWKEGGQCGLTPSPPVG